MAKGPLAGTSTRWYRDPVAKMISVAGVSMDLRNVFQFSRHIDKFARSFDLASTGPRGDLKRTTHLPRAWLADDGEKPK